MDSTTELKRYELLINGEFVPPSGGEYSTNLDPATENPISRVAQGTSADVDRAVQAARAALKPWNAIRAAERGRILMKLAELLRENQEELAALESLDAGKPIAGVQRQDVPAAIDTLAYYAGFVVPSPHLPNPYVLSTSMIQCIAYIDLVPYVEVNSLYNGS